MKDTLVRIARGKAADTDSQLQLALSRPPTYDAFISYSHAADGKLAPALQTAIERYAVPWYRRNILRIFRDETNLSATPHAWPTIELNLNRSKFLILMASPEAQASKWVRQELTHWLATKSADRLLIVLTAGAITWDDAAGDFDWAKTTALPDILRGKFADEPLHVDLRNWGNTPTELTLRNDNFANKVLRLAAPLHDKPMAQLSVQAAREVTRRIRHAGIALALLFVLAVATSIAAWLAVERQQIAEANELRALHNLYAAHVNLAQQALSVGNLSGAEDVLDAHLPEPGKPDMRGFEWFYLWRQFHREQLLLQHDNKVWDVGLSQDGRVVASVSAEESATNRRTMTLWDAHTGVRLRDVPFEGPRKRGFAFLPSGDSIVLAEGPHLRFLNLRGDQTGEIELPLRRIGLLATIPGSEKLAIVEGGYAGYAKRLLIYDLVKKEVVVDASTGLDEPMDLAATPDGMIVGVMHEYQTHLFSTGDGGKLAALVENGAKCLNFSADGKLLAIGFYNGAVKLFDTEHWELKREIAAHNTSANALVPDTAALIFSPDGKTLATGSSDQSLRIWSLETGEQLFSVLGHRNTVTAMTFAPDAKTLAAASEDGTVRFWSTRPEPFVYPERLKDDVFEFAPDGKTGVISGYGVSSGSTYLRFVDLGSMREVGNIPVEWGRFGGGPYFSLSPSGALLAVGGEDGVVSLWNTQSRLKEAELRGLDLGENISSDIQTLAWSPDGKRLAATNSNKYFRMWDVASKRVLYASELNSAQDAVFSSDGRFYCEHHGSSITCKDVDTGQTLREFARDNYRFGAFAFSPDGAFMAASATKGDQSGMPPSTTPNQFMVKVWDIRTGEETATLLGHVQQIKSLSFSPDCRTLATGGDDGMVKLWSTQTWQELLTLPASKQRFGVTVRFSPDGHTLVTAAASELKFWHAQRRDGDPALDCRRTQ